VSRPRFESTTSRIPAYGQYVSRVGPFPDVLFMSRYYASGGDLKAPRAVRWDSEPGITVLARASSSLAGVVTFSSSIFRRSICIVQQIRARARNTSK
jgi:hypothetical protein